MAQAAGVFHGRLAAAALRLATRMFSFCMGPRKRTIGAHAESAASTSHAVSVSRQAYVSPYDRAVLLLERLLCLPCIAQVVHPILVDEKAQNAGAAVRDPLQPLRTLFGRGNTLNILVNELESPFVATIDLSEHRRGVAFEQHQIALFWRGCVGAGLVSEDALARLPAAALWNVDDPDCLALMIAAVSSILDVLQQRDGWEVADPRFIRPRDVYPAAPQLVGGEPRHAVLAAELARTEVAYVQDLERLVDYADAVAPLVDACDVDLELIFGCMRRILALHRRFSARVQYLAAMPAERQLFDAAFDGLDGEFGVYAEFCATREHTQRAFDRALPALQQLDAGLDPVVDVPALFMRPVQRLAQYPILLQNMADALAEGKMVAAHKDAVVASARAALALSRRILTRANETTREATNESQFVQFFARLADQPLGGLPPPRVFGRLLTSDRVTAQVGRCFEDLEAFLFENVLAVCQPDRGARHSRIHRTISMLQMTKRRPSSRGHGSGNNSNGGGGSGSSKRKSRRGSASSASSSTLHSPTVLRARSPTHDSSLPDDKLPAVGFQLPAIDAGHELSLSSPPQPQPPRAHSPAPSSAQPLASYTSLTTLRDRPLIRFAPAPAASIAAAAADPPAKRCGASPPRLLIRELIPASAISQVTQLSELDGSLRLTIQAVLNDGTPATLAFKQLGKEGAGLWIRMLRRAADLAPVEESVARGNENYRLFVNPRFAHQVLGRALPA
ncbi:Guanine nucleotide exchange factor for Cdc42p [Coemansia javaensis]|uniref:Guanine nucleotide exchange factor for Cdc42p n=1 Tax=Coemansia javaensis TaxID=2761396 RepID=A0A9W8HBE4_9FUNG|nr:Guanine nucleotide exchange factor for Cdc42p [Coemansia javaensis]